jgi:hypothetical protein
MALFIIAIPIMAVAVLVAVVPLLLVSHAEHKERMQGVE